ncbi:MAG: C40 family peptidase [Muribaculaceae bacterium]|nr:C40 family peptidase [Muribaculaceae bacterium]
MKQRIAIIALFAGAALAMQAQHTESTTVDPLLLHLEADVANDIPDVLMQNQSEAPYYLSDNISPEDEFDDDEDALAPRILEYASTLVGKPYRWGSTGPKSFDCSGFTSHVFSQFGLNLTRSSRTQYKEGTKVDIEEVQPGDLLFFGGRRATKTVSHVAIATDVEPETGNIHFIHAASRGGIRYDSLQESSYFNRRFLGARRVLDS